MVCHVCSLSFSLMCQRSILAPHVTFSSQLRVDIIMSIFHLNWLMCQLTHTVSSKISYYECGNISKTTTFLAELVQTCASQKKVGKPQAQPARWKFWQVHAANFIYSHPFPIQDIFIIQNAYICLVSMVRESKTSFVYFYFLSLPMMMATKILLLWSV
jgi:hypothetical protein